MCGITAVITTTNKDVRDDTELMLIAMKHRGNDDRGGYIGSVGNAEIGHNRLSINDLSPNGRQPFEYNEGNEDIASVTNGEIWNFKELKESLGYNFVSESDCEVIIPLYRAGRMKELDGMFSTMILDKNKLHVYRDWVGKMPLFMVKESSTIYIASEIKALREVSKCEDVKFVPRNCHVEIDVETLEIKYEENYFGWIGKDKERDLTPSNVAQDTYELLDRAVQKRTISDVPIATLNSGGIDSSVITYLLSKYVKDIKCYTVKFDEDSPDLKHARLLAEMVGMPLVEVEVPRDPEIIKQRFKDICATIEYPSNVQVQVGIMLSFIGEQLEKDGYKVVFSGEGSDESAGSYGNYRMWSKKPDWCDVKKQMFEKQYYGNLLRGNNIFMKYGTIECRTPFFDRDYVEYVCNLPENGTTGKGKQWKQHLADAFRGKVPDEILDRPKEAFQKGTCFKTWFEDVMLNDPEINKKGRKKMHHVIQDTINEQLGYNIRKSRDFTFGNTFSNVDGLFE